VIIRFLQEAESELGDAIVYYEAQSTGLGTELALEVRGGLARIEEHPQAWQLLGKRVRRYRLNRFPYGLIYAELPSEIVILAVMHLHRRPDYWRGRMAQV
jgi:plasmid stabilization system protein ParE